MTRAEAKEHIRKRMELYIHSTLDNFALLEALKALEQPEIIRCEKCIFSEKVDGRRFTIYCDMLRDYFLNDFYCADAKGDSHGNKQSKDSSI